VLARVRSEIRLNHRLRRIHARETILGWMALRFLIVAHAKIPVPPESVVRLRGAGAVGTLTGKSSPYEDHRS
jgi:hypothetical protein